MILDVTRFRHGDGRFARRDACPWLDFRRAKGETLRGVSVGVFAEAAQSDSSPHQTER
jgi:hypothetical protein